MLVRRPVMLLAAALIVGALTLTAATSVNRTSSGDTSPAASPAATANAFLRIEGIEGGATRAGHENWIEVVSFNYGVASTAGAVTAGGARTAGRAQFQDVTVTKPIDKSSPLLAVACAEGRHYPEAELVFYAPGSTSPIGSVRLSDVMMTSAMTGSESSGPVMEEVRLSFGRIVWNYNDIDPRGRSRGTVSAGWDLLANRRM